MMWLTYEIGSRYSLVRLLPTSSSKSAPVPSVLLQCHVISYFLMMMMMMMMWLSWNWALATVLCGFCRPHLPKVLRALQFFNGLKWKSSFRYSLVRLFKTSSSKSAPDPTVFYDFMWNRALATESCALFVDQFPPSSCETAETETFLQRPRQPLYPKKIQDFAPDSVFKLEFTRSRPLTLPNYLRDDVVIEVMMWLP